MLQFYREVGGSNSIEVVDLESLFPKVEVYGNQGLGKLPAHMLFRLRGACAVLHFICTQPHPR